MKKVVQNIQNIYFLAICGTAMAALAAMMKKQGFNVTGSDHGVYPPMSDFLSEQKIPIHEGFDPEHLHPTPDLVVVGNVISRGNPEIEAILNRRIPYMSLPDALGEFFIKDKRSIVVTGTHGKTTTSSLLAWILQYAGRKPSFLIGGIPLNFGRGFQNGEGDEVVLEGDEYDSAFFQKTAKFLHYRPDIGLINNIEYDHADIYDSFKEIQTAFHRFVNLLPSNGYLSVFQGDENAVHVGKNAFCPVSTFGASPQAEWSAKAIHVAYNKTEFELFHKNKSRGNVQLPLLGLHNVNNALGAISVSYHLGIDLSIIKQALESFRGIKRRMEFKGEAAGVKLYEDFGHHPTAVKATLDAVRHQNPETRIFALFEPRSATTRRDVFQKEFSSAFANADVILIAPVDHPEKAPSDQIFSPERLADDLENQGKQTEHFQTIDDIILYLKAQLKDKDLVVSFSNGPFGNLHKRLLNVLSH